MFRETALAVWGGCLGGARPEARRSIETAAVTPGHHGAMARMAATEETEVTKDP